MLRTWLVIRLVLRGLGCVGFDNRLPLDCRLVSDEGGVTHANSLCDQEQAIRFCVQGSPEHGLCLDIAGQCGIDFIVHNSSSSVGLGITVWHEFVLHTSSNRMMAGPILPEWNAQAPDVRD